MLQQENKGRDSNDKGEYKQRFVPKNVGDFPTDQR